MVRYLLSELRSSAIPMSDLDGHNHDWDRQFRETEQVWHALKSDGVDFAKCYCLDLQFVAQIEAADKAGFAASLAAADFTVCSYHEDQTVEASVPGMLLTPYSIWQHERRATEIGFQFGFAPDGWGFMDDPEAKQQ